jgi:5-methylcytosine-specific restriction protein A
MVNNNPEIFEGIKKQITVKKYERSSIARKRCIELNGVRCQVCGIQFDEIYGEIGTGFIHIHHRIPISKIGKTYKIDYEKDLIPVCPNCHAMLHRRPDGIDIDELKSMLKKPGGCPNCT